MAKVKIDIKDPMCGFSTRVTIKNPSAFEKSTGTFYCSGCESKIFYTSRQHPQDKKRVLTDCRYVTVSPVTGRADRRERREDAEDKNHKD